MGLYLVDNGDVTIFDGDIPDNLSPDRFALDWCIFRANTPDDAWSQACMLSEGCHPDQGKLREISRSQNFIKSLQETFGLQKAIVLKLEAIGDDARQFYNDISANPLISGALFGDEKKNPFSRPWVAEIKGSDKKYKFKRAFLRGRKDYSEANNKGSRGVYYYYDLFPGKIYHVHDRVTWKHSRKYYARVSCGELIEIEESEVLSWLSECLE